MPAQDEFKFVVSSSWKLVWEEIQSNVATFHVHAHRQSPVL